MLEIHKEYVLDDEQNPIAVRIPIAEFERLEEIIENYGLAQLMDETQGEDCLSGDEAYNYYKSLKNELEG